MALYGGLPIIPLNRVRQDFFGGITEDKFIRKVMDGKIKLPIVRTDPSTQKTAKGVHVNDLADYLDKQTEAARKECEQLNKTAA